MCVFPRSGLRFCITYMKFIRNRSKSFDNGVNLVRHSCRNGIVWVDAQRLRWSIISGADRHSRSENFVRLSASREQPTSEWSMGAVA